MNRVRTAVDDRLMTLQQPAPITREWPPPQGEWTYDDWLRLPDDDRFKYEVLDGVLHMTPPPTPYHQDAAGELFAQMRTYARQHSLGMVLAAPTGVRLPGQPVPLQPDILFVRGERRAIVGANYVEGAPDLVVEVLSPSNWMYDRGEKMEAYREGGVPEYWVVDYRERSIEVFVLEEGVYVLTGRFGSGQSARSPALAGFEIAVDDVFPE